MESQHGVGLRRKEAEPAHRLCLLHLTSEYGYPATVINRYWPVPLNGMSTVGVTGSLEVILKVALFAPVEVGLKATLMVRLLPGLIVLLPAPLVIANSDASVPPMDVAIERSLIPVFVILKEAALLLFAFTFPKS